MIDRMVNLTGMTELKTLSLGRNNIKKIEKLEDVAGTLTQLWLSYNQITSLDGLSCLTNLTTLYCSNNLIKSFDELDKLKVNDQLRDVLFVGNPMYAEAGSKEKARIEILRRLPNLVKIDGEFVKPTEKEEALTPPTE
jgi:dynein light chain 1